MKRSTFSLTLFSLLLVPFLTYGADLLSPSLRVANSEVLVDTGLVLDEKNLSDLRNGISKEITFYIDLFRIWKNWPDEFITGKILVKTLWSDPIKKEHIATSFDGTTLIEKRFKTFESMLQWALNVRDLRLTGTRDLQPSDYYVKVTAVSRLRKLPPVIGYLLFFVPEKEFKVLKDSDALAIGSDK